MQDTNAVYNQAIKAGATSVMEPADQFYGDRKSGVKDPVGNTWWIAVHDDGPDALEMAVEASRKEGVAYPSVSSEPGNGVGAVRPCRNWAGRAFRGPLGRSVADCGPIPGTAQIWEPHVRLCRGWDAEWPEEAS